MPPLQSIIFFSCSYYQCFYPAVFKMLVFVELFVGLPESRESFRPCKKFREIWGRLWKQCKCVYLASVCICVVGVASWFLLTCFSSCTITCTSCCSVKDQISSASSTDSHSCFLPLSSVASSAPCPQHHNLPALTG